MSVESVLQRVAALEQALSNPALLAASARTGGTAAPSEALAATTESAAGNSPSFADALQSASSGYASTLATPASEALADTGASGVPSSGYPYASTVQGTTLPTAYSLPSSSPTGVVGLSSLAPNSLQSQTATGSVGERIVAIAESQLGQAEQPPGSNESPAIAQYRTATAGAIPGAPWCAYFASWAARQAGEPLGSQGEGLGSVGQIWSWAQSSGRAIANGPGVVPQPGDLIVFGDEHVGIVKGVLPGGDIQTLEGNYENKVSANVRSPTEATGYVNMG